MDFGIILPTMPGGANPEGIAAAAETAERLGWQTAWTTDHIIVPHSAAGEYGVIYDVIVTLGWIGGLLALVVGALASKADAPKAPAYQPRASSYVRPS